MVKIAHPRPCTYNLNGDCTWMRAYSMLRLEIRYLNHNQQPGKQLLHAVGALDKYVADCLDVDVKDVVDIVEFYTGHLGGGETSKGAEERGSQE